MCFRSRVLILGLFLLLSNCTPTLNYLGDFYSKTEKITFFYNAKEVPNNYKTIGLLNFKYEVSVFNNEKRIIHLVRNKAKEVGANAVFISKFSTKILESNEEDIISKKIVSQNRDIVFVEAMFLKE